MSTLTFRRDLATGEIIAVVHGTARATADGLMVTCYTHNDQHAECSKEYVQRRTTWTVSDDYRDLLREMLGQGYGPVSVAARIDWTVA